MDNINFNLSDDIKEKMIAVINNIWNLLREFIKRYIVPIYNWLKNNIYPEWIKYKRYLKYQKRVKNRSVLFAKRKCKYGR